MMDVRELALLKKREYRRAQYADRKCRQVCVDCEAPLEPDDSVRCAICADRDTMGKRKALQTKQGRRRVNERNRMDRQRRAARGLCTFCTRPRAMGYQCCEVHIQKRREAVRRWRERAARGVRWFRPEPRPLLAPAPECAVEDNSMHARILRGMRWLDWSTAGEIFERCGVYSDGGESREYANAIQTLWRLSKRGLVERRERPGKTKHADYRLTPAGVVEADRIRNGQGKQRRAA